MSPESSAGVISSVLAALIALQFLITQFLLMRQTRHVMRHRSAVPADFAGRVDLPSHQKAADYTAARAQLGMVTVAVEAAVLLGWTLLGGLDALNLALRGALYDPHPSATAALAYQVALVVAVSLIGALLSLPLDLIRQFGVERRFGFNRMTPALYLSDLLKSTLVGLIIGVPLLALVLWLMGQAGPLWWLWAFGALASFQVLMLVVFPTWIAPLFNRFTPLKDPALEARIRRLMDRCGFESRGVMVMDGSRRSSHGNAYFTGLGRSKRVVFFDTLLDALSPAEVEAVLAHELGHFRRRHIQQRLALMLVSALALLWLLGWGSGQSAFYTGLGVGPNLQAPNDGLALTLFLLVMPPALFLLSPLGSAWSRRHEFEADAYAAEQADGAALASALIKLHSDNAATLTPDPWYVRFHYSHPPALQRLIALRRVSHPAHPQPLPSP